MRLMKISPVCKECVEYLQVEIISHFLDTKYKQVKALDGEEDSDKESKASSAPRVYNKLKKMKFV